MVSAPSRLLEAYLDRRLRGDAEDRDTFLAALPVEARAELAARIRTLDALGMLSDGSAPPASVPGDHRLPESVGGFRIEARDASAAERRGGMGFVVAAVQDGIGRRVALKFPHPGAGWTQRGRERFRREARMLARIRHRHVVGVIGSGEVDGTPYLAMEWIEGATLESLVAGSGPMDRPRALGIAARLARALAELHEHGVIHRDVKPANVIVDPSGEPVLIDFGLAAGDDVPTLTLPGEFVGTLAYTAPEQAAGRRIDSRADVYGLAATLHHLLVGEPPVAADTPTEYLRAVSARPVPAGLGRFDRELRAVLENALAFDARRRTSTASDLADDLEALLDGRPVRARARSRAERTWSWIGRHRLAVGFSVATLTSVVLGGLGLLRWQAERAAAARRAEARLWDLEAARCSSLLGTDDWRTASAVAAAMSDRRPHDPLPYCIRIVASLSVPGDDDRASLHRDPARIARGREALAAVPAPLAGTPLFRAWRDLLETAAAGEPLAPPSTPMGSVLADATASHPVATSFLLAFLDRDREGAERLMPLAAARPDDFLLQNQLAELATAGAPELAAWPVQRAALLRPGEPVAAMRVALAELRRAADAAGQRRAVAAMRALAAAHPDHMKVAANLAWCLTEAKLVPAAEREAMLDEAEDVYRRLVEAGAPWMTIRANLANLLSDRSGHRSAQAADLYAECIPTHRHRPFVWIKLFRNLANLGRHDEALHRAEQGVAMLREAGAPTWELELEVAEWLRARARQGPPGDLATADAGLRAAVRSAIPHLDGSFGYLFRLSEATSSLCDERLALDVWDGFVQSHDGLRSLHETGALRMFLRCLAGRAR